MAELTLWLQTPARAEQAAQLAAQTDLPLIEAPSLHKKQRAQYPLLLQLGEEVALWQGVSEIKVDFVSGAARHRRLYGGGRGQPVAKACGIKSGNIMPRILDATAGLGGDAFVLATLGATVTLCERNPIVHALLADGLARAALAPEVAQIVARMTLLAEDGAQALARLAQADAADKPDVVYLDPMFPERRKASAAVKKGMAAFHTVVGGDEDAARLLPLALAAAQARVVVKRPQHAPTIDGQPAPVVQEGESVRFDMYPLATLAQS